MSFADTLAAIREQGGVVYVPHPFDRMHAIPSPATLHRHLAGDRRARGLQRTPSLRRVQRRGASLRAQVRPSRGRRLGRARAAGRRHGRAAHAPVQRARGVPPLAPHGEVLRRPKSLAYLQSLKWVAQVKEKVGGARRSRATNEEDVASAEDVRPKGGTPAVDAKAATPTRSRSATCSARSRRSTSSATSSLALGDELHVPVLGSGHPLGDVFLLKHHPTQNEIHEGVAFFGRAGQALLKSLAATRRRPARRLRDELPQVRHRGARRGPPLARPASCTSSSPACSSRWASRPSPFSQRSTSPCRSPSTPDDRRAPVVHGDDRGARDSRHRRLARRAGSEDALLDRVQDARHVVGRAAAVLGTRDARPGSGRCSPRSAPGTRSRTRCRRSADDGTSRSSRSASSPRPSSFLWLLLPCRGARAFPSPS